MHTLNRSSVKSSASFLNWGIGIVLLGFSVNCFADIVINGNQNVNSAVNYSNAVLNMSNGRFTVNTGGSLTISNSTVNVTISPTNPFFAAMTNGSINLKNTIVNVTVNGITATPDAQSTHPLIDVQQGNVSLTGNNFTVNAPFTVSLLQTHSNPTSGFTISNNAINNFHGGLYLNNSNTATVSNNVFTKVSFSNIFNYGNLNKYTSNVFLFPGNLHLGDAFDIFNSESINLSNNLISSGSSYGIYIMGGQNISIDNNKITDGLSYGIFIQTPSIAQAKQHKYFSTLLPKNKIKLLSNSNITVTNNYISLNRYGLAAGVVSQLVATNNSFIQRFSDASTRQYWTNNDILLSNASDLIWVNNFYKEAFTQEVPGDNTIAHGFTTFPAHGGVLIP